MVIELQCRFDKETSVDESLNIEEDLKIKQLLDADLNIEEERYKLLKEAGLAYEYAPMVINLNDILRFNSVDNEHTCVFFADASSYVYKINYYQFKGLYQMLTGLFINSGANIVFKEEEGA